MQTFTFRTPAKINFFLAIQKRRDDGYHELLMDLIPVSLYDEISIGEGEGEKVAFSSNIAGVEDEDNLVMKAVRALEKEVTSRFSLSIKLTKTVPAGAGLGGGSGNAGGVLVVLNKLLKLNLSEERLKQIALQLGADVPFFIRPVPSQARGIGETLTPLPAFRPMHLLLLFPGFGIPTAEAYSKCSMSPGRSIKTTYSPEVFKRLTPEINDFWSSLIQLYPMLKTCREHLLDAGALFSGLSGSGSTLYGVFQDEASQQRAFRILSRSQKEWTLFCCQTLTHHSYM